MQPAAFLTPPLFLPPPYLAGDSAAGRQDDSHRQILLKNANISALLGLLLPAKRLHAALHHFRHFRRDPGDGGGDAGDVRPLAAQCRARNLQAAHVRLDDGSAS